MNYYVSYDLEEQEFHKELNASIPANIFSARSSIQFKSISKYLLISIVM